MLYSMPNTNELFKSFLAPSSTIIYPITLSQPELKKESKGKGPGYEVGKLNGSRMWIIPGAHI